MKKKGIELSANFMVVVILSIVVLGMGLYLVRMFFSEAGIMRERIDAETERQIVELLHDNERVALPINKKTIQRDSSDVFGLGLLNVIGDKALFKIELTPGIFVSERGTKTGWKDFQEKPNFLPSRELVLENNEEFIASLPVRVPKGTESGIYVIDIKVGCDKREEPSCIEYGKNKLYVTVP